VIEVTCHFPKCRRWAKFFTTLDANPKPWPNVELGPFNNIVVPLWYACAKHHTEKHEPLVGEIPPVCDHCGRTDGIAWGGVRTAYAQPTITVWDWIFYGPGGPPDPNRTRPYCPDCAERDREYWDDMWAEYNAGRI
jgi:hypothetical protein